MRLSAKPTDGGLCPGAELPTAAVANVLAARHHPPDPGRTVQPVRREVSLSALQQTCDGGYGHELVTQVCRNHRLLAARLQGFCMLL
jgi:hypothetical protein